MKTVLQYKGKFQPVGLYEVNNELVKELLANSDWILPKEEESYKPRLKKEKVVEV